MQVNDFILTLTTDDPARLYAFYRDTVGLPEKAEMGEHALQAGNAVVMFDTQSQTKGRAAEPARSFVSLMVNDVAAERERIESHGVPFIRKEGVEYWGGVISTFIDPDGNYCQMIQYRPELDRSGAQS